MIIDYKAEWFRSGYYIYILKVCHLTKGTYYYVGMTGDRYHRAARGPFYRMMGHFNTYNLNNVGNDSQLIKGMKVRGLLQDPPKGQNIRVSVEKAIASEELKIRAIFNHMGDFDHSAHKAKQKHIESIEQHLLYLMNDAFQEHCFNQNKLNDKHRADKQAEEKAREIFNELVG